MATIFILPFAYLFVRHDFLIGVAENNGKKYYVPRENQTRKGRSRPAALAKFFIFFPEINSRFKLYQK
jgi:hypothetical protein